jgi:hypothetical protein
MDIINNLERVWMVYGGAFVLLGLAIWLLLRPWIGRWACGALIICCAIVCLTPYPITQDPVRNAPFLIVWLFKQFSP